MSDDPLLDGLIDAWRDLSDADVHDLATGTPAQRRLVSALVALEAVSRIRLVID